MRVPKLWPVLVALSAAILLAASCSGSRARAAGEGPALPSAVGVGSPRSFTLAATGDFLVHTPVAARAKATGSGRYDFRPMLAQVRSVLSDADLAVCHLETPLSADDRDVSGYPVFNAPRELADAIADSGYDSCSTASNHSLDKGKAGVEATLASLDAVHVAHSGTSRSPEEPARPELHTVRGVRVALLAYTYGLNGIRIPSGAGWLVNLIDPAHILSDARAAKAAGAEVVVVSLHWGKEYQVQPTPEQRSLARSLLASPDVDLIVGHHVHVVQPVERIGDKYVVYGLGNFLSNQSAACCPPASQDGIIVEPRLEERQGRFVVTGISYWPTWVERGSYLVRLVSAGLADPATPAATRRALADSRARTVAAVTSLGANESAGVAPR